MCAGNRTAGSNPAFSAILLGGLPAPLAFWAQPKKLTPNYRRVSGGSYLVAGGGAAASLLRSIGEGRCWEGGSLPYLAKGLRTLEVNPVVPRTLAALLRCLFGHGRTFIPVLVFALVFSVSRWSLAFCQMTTCREDCRRDPQGCSIDGVPLSWPQRCIMFSVNGSGSTRSQITAEEFANIIRVGFTTWISTDCSGERPSLEISDFGISYCGSPEHNPEGANTNEWMFRDDEWPYGANSGGTESFDASQLALTTLTFEVDTGLLLDADVELNSRQFAFSTDPSEAEVDLLSIVTHEAGHFLGLDHSTDDLATMRASYPLADTAQRDLSEDDVDAICSVYAPDRSVVTETCGPRNGYSSLCEHKSPEGGCSIPTLRGKIGTSPSWDKLALLLLSVAGLSIFTKKRR